MGEFFEGIADDLILYVRQFAWLTVERDRPEDDPGSKSGGSRPSYTLPSRLEQMRIERKEPLYDPDMPPIDVGKNFVDHLFEVGPALYTSAGSGPLSWQEMDKWSYRSGVDLDPWGFRLLARMSREWIAESSRAKKVDCPEPWDRLGPTAPKKPPMTDMQRRMRMLAQK